MALWKRWAVACATTLVVASAGLAGAGVAGAAPLPFPVPAMPALPPLPEPLRTWLTPPVPPQEALTKSFAPFQKSLAKTTPGAIGLALAPVGSDSVISLGTFTTGRAWSTLKVPVSLAAERRLGSAVVDDETKAITVSDNDAAGDLWTQLGPGATPVDAVTAVLREGHDLNTHVSSQLDSATSYPGYTMWALADQAIFGAHLPCMPGTDRLLALMGAVGPNQRWGVANLARTNQKVSATAVKGGWGPGTGTSSAFLVRQLGILTVPGGQVAVSMAAVPRSGKFSDGTAMLTKIGDWLGRNLSTVPTGQCGLG
ncbi:MAG TPA: hypothetical protein DIW80_04660 [Gordonia polyisoprenivorans]|uniref:Serine hydrolase n=1 Tax=Gordonia polyisoprenivorans TaxID=84595 RepID=A0A846WT94_9ACTN|nr:MULTISPECIES: hypothetical protein [Gordonia]MDF3282638.1 hypothetical protein [Gordonia sp. N1V]NKY03960.1 hypothetical protein [Gordonia polyisoprenivorans]UZF57877.1 hypothetical protein LH935_07800 [Gordonia polyisoprenivorans]GAB24273.1 hypothetical protein GOPIP_064_01110 [Gordonia polyisoprenivorans NBRC 16320 = JCM 10675]HCS56632.1 hypothetical protein [Gordonia polyisoprenivorans]